MGNDIEKIIITKYNSRRLYNTKTSEYITIDQIAELIRNGKEVQIIDKDTNEDITNQYLLQIISEHESKDGKTLPNDILIEIIKNYNNATQNIVPEMLSQTFNFIKKNQDQFLENFKTNISEQTKNFDNSEAIKNWNNFQSNMMNNVMTSWFKSENKKANASDQSHRYGDDNRNNNKNFNHKSSSTNHKSEIDIMKEQIEELQRKLNEKTNNN